MFLGLELRGPGEIDMMWELLGCEGVGVRLSVRSIGSPGVVGINMGEEGGTGVVALDLLVGVVVDWP
jgi:hypothetical protein